VQGVDPVKVRVEVVPHVERRQHGHRRGWELVIARDPGHGGTLRAIENARAIEELARSFEDAGFDVLRHEDGRRVVLGWTRSSEPHRKGMRARLVELGPWHPDRDRRRAELLAQRNPRAIAEMTGHAAPTSE